MTIWFAVIPALAVLFFAAGIRFERRKLQRRLNRLRRRALSAQERLREMETGHRSEARERVQVEEKLRHYLNLMDTLIHSIPSPIYFQDAEGTFRGCNRAFAEDILGLKRDRIIGHCAGDLPVRLPDALFVSVQDAGGNTSARNRVRCFETPMRCADGRHRDFLFRITTVPDGNRQATGTVGVMVDLTEKNRAARDHMQKEKFQGVLETAGAVCHELNQPLQALSGYAELALAEISSDVISPDLARRILGQTQRMADITRKLQKIARYETIPYGEHSRIIDIHKSAMPSSGIAEHDG